MFRFLQFTVNVKFPALDALIVYLREQDSQQSQIDELTTKVQELTEALGASSGELEDSVQPNQ